MFNRKKKYEPNIQYCPRCHRSGSELILCSNGLCKECNSALGNINLGKCKTYDEIINEAICLGIYSAHEKRISKEQEKTISKIEKNEQTRKERELINIDAFIRELEENEQRKVTDIEACKEQNRKKKLKDSEAHDTSLLNGKQRKTLEDTIDLMDGLEFERFCADVLKRNGFNKVDITPSSGDYGVDILAEKDSVRYAFQCKCYSTKLGNSPVQEVTAGKVFYGCHVGVVLTNSTFTEGAIRLAKTNGVLLWDRKKMLEMAKNNL